MADYKGLNITFKGNSTEASKALNILSNQARNAQGNLTGIQNALKNTETNGKALNDALKNMQLEQVGKQAEAARGKFEAYKELIPQLKKEHEELNAEIAATKAALNGDGVKLFPDGTVMSAKELKAHLNSVEEEERKVSASIDNTNRKYLEQQSAINALTAQYQSMNAALVASEKTYQFSDYMQTWGNNLQSIGDSISSIGDKMTIVSGIAAVTFGRKVISSTEEFGNAISQLGGYLDIQGSQLDEMSDQALKWGKETQFSATEAAQAMNELAKGGMTQAQISGGAMKATMELAAAGELDMANAAEVAVQAIKTFGLEASDSSAIADALAGAANKSTAEVTDLANGFKYVGGWASMAGWNINDVSGALALLSDHGLRGEMAGTALRNVMQRLAAPTNTAAKLMNQYGFSVRDSSGQMVSATEVVRRLNETFGQLGDEEKQNVLNDIFGARALPAAIALMDEGAESLQGYIDATTEVGYAEEMAQNRMGDLGWALEYLRGEAETAAVNFGQALAPTIIKVAKGIEDLLEWFNSLSDAQRTQIANMALMVVGAGPVISIVGHLTSGIGGLISTLGTVAQTTSTFVQLMREGGNVGENFAKSIALTTTPMADTAEGMQKVAEKTAAIEQGFASLATGVAVTGAITVISMYVSALMDYVEHEQEFERATDGLHNAIASLGNDIDAQTTSLENSVRGWKEVREASRELNAAQAEIADSMNEATNDAAKSTSMLENYMSTLNELDGKSSLTAGEQEKLASAVKGINDILGTSISVVDGQTGALSANIESIRKAAEAYVEYAKVQATMDAYTKVQEQIIENQIEMNRLSGEFKQNDVADIMESLFVWGDAKFVSAPWLDSYHELKKSMEQARDRAEELAFAESELESRMDGASTSSNEFTKLLEELDLLAKQAGGDLGDLGDETDAAAQAMDDAQKAAEKALKRHNDEVYKERQREYDREYRALQKALDAEYKAQQKAYDAEYKALQKALDAEYKAYQKALDAEYKQVQKSLDKQYEARQKQYDKAYKAYQKQLQAEEDALKKSLDAKYDERKKALDKELQAVKKANDAILKEAKKANDAETKAFKAETDKRVKALQDEYKAKLKLLELNSGVDAIDAQIKSLKDQTKAEKAEIKRREQEEKKAELQKAVEQAKTRRKKADAEKALNDYLAELAQEARENEREALIEQLQDQKDILKDELQAKKDALKEEYDNRIDALKESRSAEQEVLKEANDAEYEILKEKLDAQYQLQKEANDAKLQQIKDANTAELDAMKEQHSLQLEQMKESQSAQLEQLKESQSAYLESYKEQQSQQLEALKENHQAQLEALKDSQQSQLEAMKDAQQEQLQNLKDAQQDQLQELRNSLDDQLDALKENGVNATNTTKKTNSAILENTRKTNKDVESDFRTSGSRLGSTYNGTMQNIERHSEQMSSSMKSNSKSGNDSMVQNFKLGKTGATNAAGETSIGVIERMKQMAREMGDASRNGSSNVASGIGSAQGSVNRNANYLADAAYDPINAIQRWTHTSGWNAGINFSNGLSDTYSYVIRTAADIANGIASYLHFSVPEKGPLHDEDKWGGDMVDNLIEGMRSRESQLAAQSRRMAEIVSGEFNPDTNANYSVGYDVKPMAQLLTNGVTEALRGGIPQRQGVTVVVKEMNVRSESDIRRVSQELYALEANASRRGW